MLARLHPTRRLCSLGLTLLVATGCGREGGNIVAPTAPVASVVMSQATATLRVAQTLTLTATPQDAAGAALAGRSVSWSSGTPAVATVANGVVTAVSPGVATITATAEGRSGTTQVTVTAADAGSRGLVTAGFVHSCAVATDGTSWCWGGNGNGKLGIGSTTLASSPTPARVVGTERFVALSASSDNTCGLTAAGAAWCWGNGSFGALGNGDPQNRPSPTPVAGGHQFTSLASSIGQSMCGVRADGAALCWGNNQFGQLGLAPSAPLTTPQPVQGGHRFTQLSVGADFTCGVRVDGQVLCWGSNGTGAQLGRGVGGVFNSPTPEPVAGGRQFVEVHVGRTSACARTDAGAIWCWGDGFNGRLGTGDTVSRNAPAAVVGGHLFTALTVGFDWACGVTNARAILCWGLGLRLGRAGAANSSTPQPVAGGLLASDLSASSAHTCARTTAGSVWCWGFNGVGRLGDGTTTERLEPVQVTGLP